MGMTRRLACAAVAALLAGCAAQPQTAEEFRRAIPGSFFASSGSIEVSRPLPEVAATLRKKAAECLQGSVTTTVRIITEFQIIIQVYDTAWKPTVAVTQEHVELDVQAHTKGRLHLSRPPAGGPYRLVADAYPVDAGRTRLQWFSSWSREDYLARAVAGWASGENMECPNLTREWDRTVDWPS
jgi:hypothetical protein